MKYIDKIREYMEANTCFADLNESTFMFICGTEYPKNRTYKTICQLWAEEKNKQINQMLKNHPLWLEALNSGKSAEACLYIFRQEEQAIHTK